MNKILKKREEQLFNWKKKAKYRRIALNEERKKNKEIRLSRACWKKKYQEEQTQRQIIEKRLIKLEMQLCVPKKSTKPSQDKIAHHSYTSFLIYLAIHIRECGVLSLRSCQRLLVVIQCILKLNGSIPCINTIRNWENKKGYYQMYHQDHNEDDYVIIIDESFCIGKQVLLLILGVNLSKYKWEKALGFEDVELLAMGVKPYWKGEQIAALIGQIHNRKYKIKYSVTDGGNNIVKALKIRRLTRIEDCTHAFSKLIEKRYKTDQEFKDFCTQCTLLNRQCYLSSLAMICPPKLGTNSRFLNLYHLAAWGEKNLVLLHQLKIKKDKDEQELEILNRLKWLEKYSSLIDQLVQLTRLLKICFKILKHKGLNDQTIEAVKNIVASKQVPAFFKKGVEQYFQSNSALLGDYKKLLCCSDIIESYFGKYKCQRKLNPVKGITSSCLRIASYGKTSEQIEISKMMTQIKLYDIQNWKDINLLQSTSAKRKKLYKKCS